jgi:hypothetical protein
MHSPSMHDSGLDKLGAAGPADLRTLVLISKLTSLCMQVAPTPCNAWKVATLEGAWETVAFTGTLAEAAKAQIVGSEQAVRTFVCCQYFSSWFET